jgi:hypothetical protein
MRRVCIFVLAAFLFACKDKKIKKSENQATSSGSVVEHKDFTNAFTTNPLPYQLADTALLQDKDTSTINGMPFSDWIPDSTKNKIFGKSAKVKYMPLAKFENPKTGAFYIIKAESNRNKAAFLLSFDKKQQFGAIFPFLIPDNDKSTTQISSIDKAFSISRSVLRKQPDNVVAEGKDVYVYNSDNKQFNLIMTDVLDDQNAELINPIDTLSKKHKLTGDYIKDKKNIVSVRDGRKPNLLTVFVHIDNGNNDCSGELKGDAEITSPTTLIYRQAGDPCVLQFSFASSGVALKEMEGCGSHRGLECAFEGLFPRKKEPKQKIPKKIKGK